jgi:hypothetical protein
VSWRRRLSQEDHAVDSEVKLEAVLATIIFGELNIPFDLFGLAALAQIDQIIAASFVG